ncbi:hypothetical protein [Microbacterium sp. TNHR37B]|uniref:hypothetical protein n=1 Tax=Microbacterium sp. TNHR37B TaxID=1775956 RepID=UPI0007B2CE35|nr:hypothetical protein [Microbacterium sp. TNHR37B]KZE88757.1 hypothetical protein AVP41_03264 [Microbacterium sp. TNHR37B]
MTLSSRILALASASALALVLSACAGPSSPTPSGVGPTPAATTSTDTGPAEGACADDTGVTLIVDSSALAGGQREQWCVPADGDVAATDVVSEAGITTEGTDEYGDQVICRVNGLPAPDAPVGSTEDPAYVESCATMPAAFAYWSLWVQPEGGEWGYATTGLSELTVRPGESLALLFTLDGAPASPAS